MATKRPRGKRWEYCIRNKDRLEKPLYLSFPLNQEKYADEYVARLEKSIAAGIIPDKVKQKQANKTTVYDVLRDYLNTVTVSNSDERLVNVLVERLRTVKLTEINYDWAEAWVAEMKANNLSPITIRHYVGALARCFDWAQRKGVLVNPLRLLPKRYSTNQNTVSEVYRDRRLSDKEVELIQAQIDCSELMLIWRIALETGMRLREIYTLTADQVALDERTIFLDKTKNGDKRQVPMSSIALNSVKSYLQTLKGAHLFPSYYSGVEDLNKVTSKLSKKFQRIFKQAGVHDFRFHDIRHHATCQFFLKTSLSPIEIALITGHKDPRMLKRYANLRGSELAGKLW